MTKNITWGFGEGIRFNFLHRDAAKVFGRRPEAFYFFCRKVIEILVIVLAGNSYASAQSDPISTDRPDQSTSPLLIPQGSLQVETGYDNETDKRGEQTIRTITVNTTLLKYGLTQNIELRLEASAIQTRFVKTELKANTLGPLGVGVKLNLIDEKGGRPNVSFIGSLSVDSFSKTFSVERTAADLIVACSHALGKKSALTYNAISVWLPQYAKPVIGYTLSYGYTMNNKTGVFVETYSYYHAELHGDQRMNVGATYKLNPVFQVDCFASGSLKNLRQLYSFGVGLSARFFK